MTTIKNEVEKTILTLKNKSFVDLTVLRGYLKRLGRNSHVLRDEGVTDHFCTFCAPVNKQQQKIFIGHHIKSGSWIPPGGHIDLIDQTPIDTVKREFKEELKQDLRNDQIKLFNISHIKIPNRPGCTEHYDIWYLVHLNDLPIFTFDKGEFYEAGWYSLDEALQKKSRPEFKAVLKKLETYISS